MKPRLVLGRRGERALATVAAVLLLGATLAHAAPPDIPPTIGRIDVDPVPTVATDTAGAVTEAEGGFSADLWKGTPRSLVEALMPRLPVTTPSPTMRALTRRLLLSAAAPPSGEGTAGSLLDERAWLLWRMGELDSLLRLIEAVPADGRSARLLRLETEARLLANDTATVCKRAEERVARDPDAFWQKVLGFCHVLRGAPDEAELSVALLADRGHDVRTFAALIGAIAGTGTTVPKLPDPTPLDIAMLRAAKLSPSADAAAAEDMPLLLAIAETPEFVDALRVAAAERAVAAGALSAGRLRQLYQRVPPGRTATTAHRGASRGEQADAAAAVALVRRAFAADTAVARAEATVQALDAARGNGRYLAVARAVSPELAAFGPAPELTPYAQALVPAMLAVGERALAAAWISWLTKQAPLSPVADAAVTSMMPLARLARMPQAADWPEDGLFAWWQAERSRPGGRLRAERLFVLRRATGEAVPDALWTTLLDGPAQLAGTTIDPAFRTQLSNAARARRLGECVLLALVSIGSSGPEGMESAGLEAIIEALRISGLENDARGLAVEAMAATQ